MRILAVDDDAIVLAILEEALQSSGRMDNTFVSSAEEAMEAIVASPFPFDCFLLDVRMPGMDGIELCRRIKADPLYADVPVIMVSAVSDRSAIDEAYAAGAMDFVNKPIDPFDLNSRLHSAEILIHRNKAANRSAYQAQLAKDMAARQTKVKIEDAIEITDVNRVVGQLALENNLLSLSRFQLLRTEISGIAVPDFGLVYAQLHPAEVYDFLADVAEAIVSGLKTTNSLVAYYGYGEFICVSEKSSHLNTDEVEFIMNEALDALELTYADGMPCDVDLVVGQPVHGTVFSAGKPLALVDQALDNLAHRRSEWSPRRSGRVQGHRMVG